MGFFSSSIFGDFCSWLNFKIWKDLVSGFRPDSVFATAWVSGGKAGVDFPAVWLGWWWSHITGGDGGCGAFGRINLFRKFEISTWGAVHLWRHPLWGEGGGQQKSDILLMLAAADLRRRGCRGSQSSWYKRIFWIFWIKPCPKMLSLVFVCWVGVLTTKGTFVGRPVVFTKLI